MAFEGTLKDFALPDILQLIALQRKTGILTLEGPEDRVGIYFQEGAIVWVRSRRDSLEARMRRVLCLRGLVTEEQMAEAERLRADTGQRLGDVLLRQFSLAEVDWRELVEQEIGEALYRLFRWREGTYRFEAKAALDATEGRITPLTVEAVLMEGVRRIDEWPLIEPYLPRLEGVAYRIGAGAAGGAAGGPEPAGLAVSESRVLDLVDGRARVVDVVDASGLGEFEGAKALASLMAAGVVGVRPERKEAAAAPPPKAAAAWGSAPVWALAALWLALNLALFRPWQAFLAPSGEDLPQEIRARAARAALALHLDQYFAETGSFPPDLGVLVRRGMVHPSLVTDPWGRAYYYEPQGDRYVLGMGRPASSGGAGAASRPPAAR